MGDTDVPPGGGHRDKGGGDAHHKEAQDNKMSYSDRLKTNVRYDQRLKRNVLEITLEKTETNANIDEVDPDAIARVLKTLGIDIASQTQGYQVHFKGKISIISVWMAAGINLDRFCKEVNIKVARGVMTGMIRPAGKTDVTVKVDGLDFNTPDNFVIDYLNKFGIVKSNVVVYSKYDTGPFKGKFSGERKFQVDFSKAQRQMGTFHIIDGSKVRVFYRGNRKTCGRCHKLANECPGEAIARNCAAGGGARVFLSDHMKALWNDIGFVPTSFELDESDKIETDTDQAVKDAPIISETSFPPKNVHHEPSNRDIELSDGVIIKNIPSQLEDNAIINFLRNYGMPFGHEVEHISINREGKNIKVTIEELSPTDVKTMFKSIHFHEAKIKFFGVPLYCTAIRNMTPKKKEDVRNENADKKDKQKPVDNHVEEKEDNAPPDTPKPADEQKPVDKHVEEKEDNAQPDTPKPAENPSSKPKIPGLSEEERLKSEKKKRKKERKLKQKQEQKEKENDKIDSHLTINDFLVSPRSGLIKKDDKTDDFVFGDSNNDTDDNEDSDEEEGFEDSRETLSENEELAETGMATPSLKSVFARTLVANSASKPSSTSTPTATKRAAKSPANAKDSKKPRGRSKSLLPKKK